MATFMWWKIMLTGEERWMGISITDYVFCMLQGNLGSKKLIKLPNIIYLVRLRWNLKQVYLYNFHYVMLSSILWGWIVQYTEATRNSPQVRMMYLQIWYYMDIVYLDVSILSSHTTNVYMQLCCLNIIHFVLLMSLPVFVLNARIKF